jgi:hypothetical protein
MLNREDTSSNLLMTLVTLFTSSGTLLCCALPALFVSIGAGATLASIVSAVPQLIWVSKHKALVFGLAGAMLLVSGLLRLRPQACPIDPKLATACARARKYSAVLYWASVLVYATGAFFAFVMPHFVRG